IHRIDCRGRGHWSSRLPTLEQRTDDHGPRPKRDKWHRVADEIESTLHRRHENLLAIHRLEGGEDFLGPVATRYQPHHVRVHRRRDAASEVSGTTRINVEITTALAMYLMLELVPLRIGHR